MRVTESMLFQNFLSNLNNVNTQLYNTQNQMATGKSINNLSDNPIALSQILTLNDTQARLTQYTSNINLANATLSAQDTATQNISTLLQNSGSLIIQAANATNDTASNTSIAQQLSAIENEIKNSANTTFGGNYLFSGFLTNTAPVQNITQAAAIISAKANFQISATANFGDINQFQSGTYTASISNGELTIKDQNGNSIPISANGVDQSVAGGNQLSNSVNVSNVINNGGGWVNTGRGVKIYVPAVNTSSFTFSYTQGGNNVYMGDNNNQSIDYSDNLSTPIAVNAHDMLYQQNQILQSNNQLLNSSNDPATAQTKLTNLHLSSALGDISLQTGYTIVAKGTDHNGNIISGAFSIPNNMSAANLDNLLSFINHLSTKEVLQNNETLTLPNGSIASSSDTISSIDGLSSSVVVKGLSHSGGTMISKTFSAGTTIGSFLNGIGSAFGVNARISHGVIKISDNTLGSSVLNIGIQTSSGSLPIFGIFNSISHGISNAFLGTVSATVQHGSIVIQDLRGGQSDLNLSLNVVNQNNTPVSNIFGVFNTTNQGGGVNVFDTFNNAQAAILGESVNQISQATGFRAGSTLIPLVSGYYAGQNSDKWTFTVTAVNSGISLSSLANLGKSGNAATVTITNASGATVGSVNIAVNSHGTYNISVTSANNTTVITSAANLNNIRLPDGLVLNLSSQAGVTPILKDGDSFSVKLTNMLQQSITNIQSSLSQIDANRSVIGAYEQRATLAQTRINNTSLSNNQTLSNLQDANYAQVISNYETEITIMQALLQSFAKVNQLSLFNYL